MRIRRLLWTLTTISALAWAQDPKMTQKLIEVKFADVERVRALVNGPGISLQADRGMHVIIVRGTSDAIAAVEEMVKKLDVPPPNIEFTVDLVAGLAQGTGDDLPKDLASTAKQLHGLFAYKSYRILQSFVLRNRDGGRDASTSGSLPSSGSSYDFRFRSATVSNGTPRVVHIDGIQLMVRTPTGKDKDNNMNYSTSTINTEIDAGEGQKIVVGKSSVNGSDDALILVVTAKVVE